VRAFSKGDLVEYEGSSFLENELIMASPDKMMFLIKDMVSHLTRAYKKHLNPFLIARLDLNVSIDFNQQTIDHFEFQDISLHEMVDRFSNKLDVNFTKNFIET